MSELITADALPRWVPGELTVDSAPLGWHGARLRGFRYKPLDVAIPPLQDYAIVVYRQGATRMHRRCTGEWHCERVAPGTVSLLTQATDSHWRWSQAIEVMHLYLSAGAVADVAAQVHERQVRDVELLDVLRAEDPVLSTIAASLAREAHIGGLGGRLYVDALRTQACVHVLRNYARVTFREQAPHGGLSQGQRRLLLEYVEANLGRNIALEDLAGVAGLSVFHFTRKFRAEFGCPPHAFVMRQRLERARRRLARRDIPLKVVAADCGFADQSHMNRVFRHLLGTTPAQYRDAATG